MEQKEYFGLGSIRNLRQILKDEKSENVFLVTGRKSYELSGAKEELERIFSETNIQYSRFSNFSPNPKIEEVEKGVESFQRNNYNAIVAVGGGSAIDVAKAIKKLDNKEHRENPKHIPLIAIPTTAGSGSEATHFIVYYIGKEKQSKGDPNLTMPNYSISDSQLTLSLPKHITAASGMDALSQAVESYWCVNSTPRSKELAEKAITLLLTHLEQAVNKPNQTNKENVMRGANLAGKAINITSTTACHAISYPITSYFQVQHGHAVGLTLGEILVHNSQVTKDDCLDLRGEKYVKETINKINRLFKSTTPQQTKHKIQTIMQNIGLETKLSGLGLTKEDLNIILQKGFNPGRIKNNPRFLTEYNLKKLLLNIY